MKGPIEKTNVPAGFVPLATILRKRLEVDRLPEGERENAAMELRYPRVGAS